MNVVTQARLDLLTEMEEAMKKRTRSICKTLRP
ncbi:MAG: hypothetical protein CM1200mP23_4880 [Nitrososphaerota archaeon]|nr:MAG: hypothetical protein CM1200mP23_4880 [Nitrososphaerota archaeon]